MRLKTRLLVHCVVELAKRVRVFGRIDERLETFRASRIFGITFGKRRNLDGVMRDEGRLDEMLLAERLEHRVDDKTSGLAFLELDMVLCRDGLCFFVSLDLVEIDPRKFLEGIGHGEASPRRREVDLLAFVFNHGRAVNFFRHIGDEFFGNLHHIFVIRIRLVEFDRGVFGIVGVVHALVAEHSAHLVDFVKTAHDEAFEIEFVRDTHVHRNVERIVMGHERARIPTPPPTCPPRSKRFSNSPRCPRASFFVFGAKFRCKTGTGGYDRSIGKRIR